MGGGGGGDAAIGFLLDGQKWSAAKWRLLSVLSAFDRYKANSLRHIICDSFYDGNALEGVEVAIDFIFLASVIGPVFNCRWRKPNLFQSNCSISSYVVAGRARRVGALLLALLSLIRFQKSLVLSGSFCGQKKIRMRTA